MPRIIFVSGACGCGKTTFADAYARHLAQESGRTVYVIHGDDFRAGFVEPETPGGRFRDGHPADTVRWENVLRFNWDCILATAGRALREGLDTVIDYVIEDELPRVEALAEEHGADLYYFVLTAEAGEIERRIRQRGDTDLISRALFLKEKLEAMPENRGRLIDNTALTPAETIAGLRLERYLLRRGGAPVPPPAR